jgi:hypothetical protein
VRGGAGATAPATNVLVRLYHVATRSDGRSHALTAWLFLRLLGICYLLAFASLWPQLRGLFGANGILPAHSFLASARQELGPHGYLALPTLAWWDDSDRFLLGLCGAGLLLSLLLALDIMPTLSLFGAWLCYLSLVNVGQDFFSFQWDSLLLETGFLALFLAPAWRLRPRPPLPAGSTVSTGPPSRTALWLLRWLLFRLMFFAGVVKHSSGDPTWHRLAALRYHYETQPLPTPLAWYAHQMPAWYHTIETAAVLAIELVAPLLIFARHRRVRLAAAGLLAGLQVLILLTGNYAYFNLLALALCLLLLDDAFLFSLVPRRWRRASASVATSPPVTGGVGEDTLFRSSLRPGWRLLYLLPLALFTFVLSAGQLSGAFLPIPGAYVQDAASALVDAQAPFHLFNGYGLFAVMTTTRPEIIVEGSRDGTTWTEYPFRYKPGDVFRVPGWVAPHQPRLDWQMWFAALEARQGPPVWFERFLVRLLQGSPDVLALLAKDPFDGTPPRFVRAELYDYRFTNWATRRASGGAWWRRERLGVYFPPASLRRQ